MPTARSWLCVGKIRRHKALRAFQHSGDAGSPDFLPGSIISRQRGDASPNRLSFATRSRLVEAEILSPPRTPTLWLLLRRLLLCRLLLRGLVLGCLVGVFGVGRGL